MINFYCWHVAILWFFYNSHWLKEDKPTEMNGFTVVIVITDIVWIWYNISSNTILQIKA